MVAVPAVPSTQPSQLCEYCHQKPKFSNHLYCSKTCAGQAATLCNHCQKKPKFQNFDYCGKKCAALVTPAKVSAGVAFNGPQVTAGSKQKGSGANTQGTQGFDPVQLAKLVAQHIPQVQAMLTPPPNQAVGSAQAVPPAATQSHLSNNPFLDPTNQAAYQIPNSATVPSQDAMTNGAVYSVASSNPPYVAQQLHISTQPSADDLECFIPGCGKPVRVDAQGMKTSNYCSMRHREEAVASGLVSPCIMCLALPQSEADYFCSRTCKEGSMNKDKWDCSE